MADINLGHATAYGYAKSKGYTGTEEEFAQLMANYGTVGQTATQAAQTATTKASEAASSASNAASSATDAANSAQEAADIVENIIDNTLTQEGKAADAKVTGDEINNLKDDLIKILPHEASTTVTHNYIVGDYFIYDYTDTLYQAIADILSGQTFVSGGNAKVVTAPGALNALRKYTDDQNAILKTNINFVYDNLLKIPFIYPYKSSDITAKKYIQSDGTEKTQNGWNITDYLPVVGIVTYSGITTVSANVYAQFYASDKTAISVFNPSKNTNVLSYPSNAAFVRFSIANADLNGFVYTLQLTPSFDDISPFSDIIALPENIYLYNGIQTNIYRDSLFVPDDAQSNFISVHGMNYDECWRLQPTSSFVNDETLTVQRYDEKYTNVLKQKSATLHFGTAEHNAGTINCIFIGDSTTEQGRFLYPLLNNFSSDATTIQSIGTRHTLNYNDIMCEGRSGWRLLDYVTYASLSTVTNAFWNPSTSSFDFSYYMQENHSGVMIDYVFILLGINDVVKLNNADIDTVKSSAQTFVTNLNAVISSIKEYDSNIKVVYGLITVPAKTQDAWYTKEPDGFHYRNKFKRNIVLFNSIIIDGLHDNNDVYVIDTNLCIDAAHNMETTTEQVNSRNTMEITRQNNLVHYPLEGGAQVADRIFSFIKCV